MASPLWALRDVHTVLSRFIRKFSGTWISWTDSWSDVEWKICFRVHVWARLLCPFAQRLHIGGCPQPRQLRDSCPRRHAVSMGVQPWLFRIRWTRHREIVWNNVKATRRTEGAEFSNLEVTSTRCPARDFSIYSPGSHNSLWEDSEEEERWQFQLPALIEQTYVVTGGMWSDQRLNEQDGLALQNDS